ncbi:MAG: FAD-dependent oxidoreductase [Orrella sp.]
MSPDNSLTIVLANPRVNAVQAVVQATEELLLTADLLLMPGGESLPLEPVLAAVGAAHTVVLSVTDSRIQRLPNEQRRSYENDLLELQVSWGSSDLKVGGAGERRAIVVGAGISGLTTAAVLGMRGWSVTVVDPYPPGPESRHAQHLAAALTPVISSDDNERSQLARAGALAADRFWSQLPAIIGRRCGALQLQKPESQSRWVDLRAVSEAFDMPAWAHWVDAAQASDLAEISLDRGGLWMPGGWLVQVAALLKVLAKMPGVEVVAARADQVRRQAGHWQVLDEVSNNLAQAPTLVLANASDTYHLLKRSGLTEVLPVSKSPRVAGLHQLAGEITCLPAQALSGGPACIVGGDGYVLPAVDGWCVSGGTYLRGVTDAYCTPEGVATNIKRAGELLNRPDLAQTIHSESLPGWAGFRAVLPGRLPAIGPAGGAALQGLWLFTGAASRGLTWSVLGAELIADALDGAPPKLNKTLLKQVFPGL